VFKEHCVQFEEWGHIEWNKLYFAENVSADRRANPMRSPAGISAAQVSHAAQSPSLADFASNTGKLMAGQRHTGSGDEQKSQIIRQPPRLRLNRLQGTTPRVLHDRRLLCDRLEHGSSV
jgi:hypothetical protein